MEEKKNLKKLVLLHSNHKHGDFLAESVDDKLVGGVSRLSCYIKKVRREEPNTLYCIAGDMFRGSVLDSEFLGLSTIQIMNALGPNIATIGNHEVDYGLTHLLFIEKCANFPIVNANLHIKMNGTRLFAPCKVIEIGGMKVLFIGIITEQVLAQTKNDGQVGAMVDVAEAAREVGRICNTYNGIDIDFTVILTHIGWEEDHQLAELLDPAWSVDVIIGGHSHTFIEQPDLVNGVLIAQAGTGTDQVGRFDLMINTDINRVDSYTWQAVPIDNEHCPETDAAVERIIASIKEKTDSKYNRVVTHLYRELTHPSRIQETELGNLMADIMKDSLSTDLAMFGSGSIRNEELGPLITFQDLVECVPYDSKVWEIKLSGAQLKHAWAFINRDEVWEGAHCEYYQLSKGCKMVYSKSQQKVIEFSLNGEPLEDDKLYSIALQDFHFTNMEGVFNIPVDEIKANMTPRVISTSDQEIIDEWLQAHQLENRVIEGRIVVVD